MNLQIVSQTFLVIRSDKFKMTWRAVIHLGPFQLAAAKLLQIVFGIVSCFNGFSEKDLSIDNQFTIIQHHILVRWIKFQYPYSRNCFHCLH